jgi:hypothetical protein
VLESQTTMSAKGIMRNAIDGFIPGNIPPVKVGAPVAPTVYSAANIVLGNLVRFSQAQAKEKLSPPSDVEVVKLIPHHLQDVQEAARFNWANAGIGPEEIEDRADEIDWAIQSVVLLRTRELPLVLLNKLWEDQYTLSLRGFDVRCEIWDERIESGEWGTGQALSELEKERNRLKWLAGYVVDPKLKSLMAEQDSFLMAREIEFMVDR